MSVESAKEFLEKVKTDEALAKSLQEAETDDARKAIATDAGYDFSKEEMKEAMGGGKELSDEDLDAVAGGSSATWVSTGASAAGAAAAAA